MNPDPIALLGAAAAEWGAPLDPKARALLVSYLEDVRAKNATTNLTADGAWDDLVLKHAADGVFAAAALKGELAAAQPRILDLGAGAGFIGVALKIAWPQAQVTLMESVERKFRFLNAATAKLGLSGLRVLRRRAGDGASLSSYEKDFDAVVERALAPLPEALSLAVPMLGARGLFAAFQTQDPDPRDPALARALAVTAARVLKSRTYQRPGETIPRRLVIFARGED